MSSTDETVPCSVSIDDVIAAELESKAQRCDWGFLHNRQEDFDILKHPDYAGRVRLDAEHRARMNELYERQELARTALVEKVSSVVVDSIDQLFPLIINFYRTMA